MDPTLQRRINYTFFAACWVAPLSIVGSALTLRAIYHQFREKNGLTTYQRLLMGISTSDLVLSTALAFGPFPIRSELQELYGIPAYGTVGTCTAQGFVLQLGAASFVYSSMLLLYFVLVIRYNATTQFLRRIEPIMHAIPIAWHVVTAWIGLAWKIYNPSGINCWVGAWPLGCEEDPDVECDRGDRVELFGHWFVVYPFIFWTCLTMLWTVVIAVTVAQQNRTRLSYQFARSVTTTSSTQIGESSCSASTTARSSRRSSFTASCYYGYASQPNTSRQTTRGQAKLQQAVTQAMLYGLWFLNFTVWSLLSFFFGLTGKEMDDLGQHFWLAVCVVTFFPMQGLFNFVIYVRPTYVNIRTKFPSEGRWFAVREAVWRPFASHQERLGSRPSSSSQKTPLPPTKEEEEYNNHLTMEDAATPPVVQPGILDHENAPHSETAAPSLRVKTADTPEESPIKSVAFLLPDSKEYDHHPRETSKGFA